MIRHLWSSGCMLLSADHVWSIVGAHGNGGVHSLWLGALLETESLKVNKRKWVGRWRYGFHLLCWVVGGNGWNHQALISTCTLYMCRDVPTLVSGGCMVLTTLTSSYMYSTCTLCIHLIYKIQVRDLYLYLVYSKALTCTCTYLLYSCVVLCDKNV